MKTFLALSALFAIAAAQTEIYSGCGTVKGCVGNKDGCIDTMDCVLVQTWQQNSDGSFNWEVQANEVDAGNGAGWVAVGWGMDTDMGDDTAIICNDASDDAKVYWNVYYNDTVRFPLEVEPQPAGVTLGAIQAIGNDYLYCSFTRDASIQYTSPEAGVGDVDNDLSANAYNAMASTGQTDANGEPTRHTKAMVTDDAIDFTA